MLAGPATTRASIDPDLADTASSGDPQICGILRFKRHELNTDAQSFWDDLIHNPYGDNAVPGSTIPKKVLQIPRVDVAAEVYARGDQAELDAAGMEASRQSKWSFLKAVEALDSLRADGQDDLGWFQIMKMDYVGLLLEGRGGLYDLLWFPHRNVVYATDSFDKSIVYRLVVEPLE